MSATLIAPAAQIYMSFQACNNQQERWDTAQKLTEQFQYFLPIVGRVPVLQQRQESREAVASMVNLIEEIARYIANHAPAGPLGM